MKGQAAIEFLTTYGWMFLLLLVAFGGLSYFGVLNPTNFVEPRCSLDQIACPQFVLYESDPNASLALKLENNFAEAITVTNLTIEETRGTASCGVIDIVDVVSGTSLSTLELTIPPGNSGEMEFVFENGLAGCDFANAGLLDATNVKRKYDLRLYYLRGRATLPSSTLGEMIVRAEN